MRKLSKPELKAEDVFMTCISIVQDTDLKACLIACKDLVTEATEEFDAKVSTGDIHTIRKESLINGNVTASELKQVYTSRMVGRGTPGRSIYDKLISSPTHGICPLCSHRLVETLDHYLPKSEYPRLVVSPVNLIPSCTDCNRAKSTHSPKNPEEEGMHPYYDDIEEDIWLKALVVHSSPPVVEYYVEPVCSWSDLLKRRVKNHFSSLSLAKLYTSQAAVELTNISHTLESKFKHLGAVGVKFYLGEAADSRFRVNKNSWRTALYKALAQDDWYCNGGFKIDY